MTLQDDILHFSPKESGYSSKLCLYSQIHFHSSVCDIKTMGWLFYIAEQIQGSCGTIGMAPN